ncbi:hypothetical protein LAZ67_8004014 [Cordylochernes scorpioides]|uniref:MHC class I antigen n=1 Tax=Cordylochernes scorpioides TaxID=51811 RepID=A0ABY6KS24_9ARAC|nr:hypothetical protein LAZ67_8004014 [Cordylochernes scorpioides]
MTFADPGNTRHKPIRWYEAEEKQADWDFRPKPTEWQAGMPSESVCPAWLRFQRKEAPTEEEIASNEEISRMKKINAKKLEEKEAARVQYLPSLFLQFNKKKNIFLLSLVHVVQTMIIMVGKSAQCGNQTWVVAVENQHYCFNMTFADPGNTRHKPIRWYEAEEKQADWDFRPKPTEWQAGMPSESVCPAWLRFQRKEAPTEEEIASNEEISRMKKINAKKLEEKEAARVHTRGSDHDNHGGKKCPMRESNLGRSG